MLSQNSGACSDCCKSFLTPRNYYLVLVAALALCSISLARRSAPWGFISRGSRTYTEGNRVYYYEMWLNPLTAEGCDTYISGKINLVSASGGNLNVNARDIVQCIELTYDKWMRIHETGVVHDYFGRCRAAGFSSFVLMILAMFFTLIGVLSIRCCYERWNPRVHYILLGMVIVLVIVAVTAFYGTCVSATNRGFLFADGRYSIFALGYVYALLGTVFLLLWSCMHGYALYIHPSNFFTSTEKEVLDNTTFAEARARARSSNAHEIEVGGGSRPGSRAGSLASSPRRSTATNETQNQPSHFESNPFDEMTKAYND